MIFWRGKALTALARGKEAFESYMYARNLPNKNLLTNNITMSNSLLRSDKDRIKIRKEVFPKQQYPIITVADGWSHWGAYTQTFGQFEAALFCYEKALEVG